MDPREAANMNNSKLSPEGYASLARYYYARYVWTYRQIYDQQHQQGNYTYLVPPSELLPPPVQNTNHHLEALNFSRTELSEAPVLNQPCVVESIENNPTQSVARNEIPSSTNENNPGESQQNIQNLITASSSSDMTETPNDFQVVNLGQKKIKLRIVAGTNEYYAKKREEKVRLKTLEAIRRKKIEEQKMKAHRETSIPYVVHNTKTEEYFCTFDLCKFVSKEMLATTKHVQIMHGPDTIVCCNKLYPTKAHFEAHEPIEHSDGFFYCQFAGCKKSYVQLHYLNKHLNAIHGWKGAIMCSVCSTILPHPSVNGGMVKEHAICHSSKNKNT